jgi:hypothetical protein
VEAKLAEQKLQHPKQELQPVEAGGTQVEVSSRVSVRQVIRTKRFLKILPMLMAGLYLTNTILSSFGIDYSIFSYLTGIGIIPWIFILMSSYQFKFCEYHRMFLWYILGNNIICWADWEFGLPISDWWLFTVHIAFAGICLFLVLYFHQKCRRKS